MRAHLILGNQLFKKHPALELPKNEPKIFIESVSASSKYKYHKLKLIFVFSSMRHYADQLKNDGHNVIYIKQSKGSISVNLTEIISDQKINEITYMQPADIDPRKNLSKLFKELKIETKVFPNMLHITTEEDFEEWFKSTKKPIMENFYRLQRRKLNILMDGDKPVGGEFNYDKENRKPLPKSGIDIPKNKTFEIDEITKEVIGDVNKNFADNPGSADNIWFAINHEQAEDLLEDFVTNRLDKFGPYEDAIKIGEPFLFHSVLSPYINNGLLEVNELIERVLAAKNIPLPSLEGFIRQVIGWREYMYGLYCQLTDLKECNYFNFDKQLEDWWFDLDYENKSLPEPIVNSLNTLKEYGYNHHIERLMVLGNWFLINEYDPSSVNKWFMSMYIDAYEWVMTPNVMGMSQYADGGKVATKPYISGDAYLSKMGNFSKVLDKNNSYTEKYWEFLKNNHEKLKNNPRMSLSINQALKRNKIKLP